MQLPDDGPAALFSFVVAPLSRPMAAVSLCAFALVVLLLACWRVRRFEVNYSHE